MNQFHDTGMTFNHGPCRPQQRVGNPLPQVVLTPGTEPADWPAQAAKRNTKRIVTSALSDAVNRRRHAATLALCAFVGMGTNRGIAALRKPSAGIGSGHRITHLKPVIASTAKQSTARNDQATETELDNPTSPVPAPPQTPAHDCYIDQHGNCPAADTELCDLHCPYRDETEE